MSFNTDYRSKVSCKTSEKKKPTGQYNKYSKIQQRVKVCSQNTLVEKETRT